MPEEDGQARMRILIGLLAGIGLMVVLVFLASIGLFAYDEVKRRVSGEEFEPEEASAEENGS